MKSHAPALLISIPGSLHSARSRARRVRSLAPPALTERVRPEQLRMPALPAVVRRSFTTLRPGSRKRTTRRFASLTAPSSKVTEVAFSVSLRALRDRNLTSRPFLKIDV